MPTNDHATAPTAEGHVCSTAELGSRKPSRADLLRIITELQNLVGEAQGAFENDRSTDRAARVQQTLGRAFDLCVRARSFDPPERARS